MAYSINSTDDSCYPGTRVLINKLGLRNQKLLSDAETVVVPLIAAQIESEKYDAPFTFDYYCSLHKRLFGDIYDWAGKTRTINLSKKGTTFYSADTLEKYGDLKFQYLQSENEFQGLEHVDFAAAIAEFYHDINLLHPFREGNGRVQRLFFTLLIRRAGYDINFADCDTNELMIATIYAAQGVLDFLVRFFQREIKSDVDY